MRLTWEDRKTKLGEAVRCRAKLPGQAGWINLTEYSCGGCAHGHSFALHYMADKLPDGLPRFSGMVHLSSWQGGMDALKSAAAGIMLEDMSQKIAAYEDKIRSIKRVAGICGG